MTTATAAEVTLEIPAPPGEVFRYLTDPACYVRWMGSAAILDARPGGRYEVSMGDGFRAGGRFETVEPHRRLVFTWGFGDDASHTKHAAGEAAPAASVMPDGSTRVTVTLSPAGAGTRLVLRHDHPPSAELVAAHQVAWDAYLPRLATVLGGRDPGPDPHSAT